MRCQNCGDYGDLKAYRIEYQNATGQPVCRAFFVCSPCSEQHPEWIRAPAHDLAKTDTLDGQMHELRIRFVDLFDAISGSTSVEYMPAFLTVMSFIALAVALVNSWWIESLLATSFFAISIYTDKRIRRQHTV